MLSGFIGTPPEGFGGAASNGSSGETKSGKAILSCRDTGHALVMCECTAVVFECRCGVPALEKAAWFAAYPTSITRVLRCLACRPVKRVASPDRRTRPRRKNLTMPGRQFDARQTTRRK